MESKNIVLNKYNFKDDDVLFLIELYFCAWKEIRAFNPKRKPTTAKRTKQKKERRNN